MYETVFYYQLFVISVLSLYPTKKLFQYNFLNLFHTTLITHLILSKRSNTKMRKLFQVTQVNRQNINFTVTGTFN